MGGILIKFFHIYILGLLFFSCDFFIIFCVYPFFLFVFLFFFVLYFLVVLFFCFLLFLVIYIFFFKFQSQSTK